MNARDDYLVQRERDIIRSAKFELPQYELLRDDRSNAEQAFFTLRSPAGKPAASLTAYSGDNPWILLAVPFSPERALQECVLVKRNEVSGFLMDQDVFTDINDISIDDSVTLLSIWKELPSALQLQPDPDILPDRRFVRPILCFTADAYRKIGDLDCSPPNEARDRLLANTSLYPRQKLG